MSAQGIKIGVIKSDAHGFNLDVEGKDSYRFQSAGAESVAVISPKSWFMIRQTTTRADFQEVLDVMTGVDLIFTESRTKNIFPTISLWRGRGEVIADDKVAAIFTSEPFKSTEIIRCDINDLSAAERLCKFLGGL